MLAILAIVVGVVAQSIREDAFLAALSSTEARCGWARRHSGVCVADKTDICATLLEHIEKTYDRSLDAVLMKEFCASEVQGAYLTFSELELNEPDFSFQPVLLDYSDMMATVEFDDGSTATQPVPLGADWVQIVRNYGRGFEGKSLTTSATVQFIRMTQFCGQVGLQNLELCSLEDACAYNTLTKQCQVHPMKLHDALKSIYALVLAADLHCRTEYQTQAECKGGVRLGVFAAPPSTSWLLVTSAGLLSLYIACALICPMPRVPKKRRCSLIRTTLGDF